jgi:hypothetical protein
MVFYVWGMKPSRVQNRIVKGAPVDMDTIPAGSPRCSLQLAEYTAAVALSQSSFRPCIPPSARRAHNNFTGTSLTQGEVP